MSYPFIIWTMRRTGGTTLAGVLETLSEYPQVAHEPFNPDRVFGYITNNWFSSRDTDALRADIAFALADRPVIKHCYELRAPQVNDCLMQVTTEMGYRHIILDRRAEDDRILSLELAQATGTWGGPEAQTVYGAIMAGDLRPSPVDIEAAMAHMEHCLGSRKQLLETFHHHGQAPFVVYYEDVYTDVDAGRALVRRIVEFLGINPDDHPGYDDLVSDALLGRGQNSAQILEYVPHGLELRALLQKRLRNTPEAFVAS